MALFNYATKEITLKIVYYGPGLSGKTTNIQYLHSALNADSKGKLLSLATESDRTLFFDFLPIELGKIRDFSIRFQLYTVPGQVRYNATRKVVLKGADAVVFVADSQRDMSEQNIESFENMRENLISNNINPDEIPVVLQYNKRDLSSILTLDELNSEINRNMLFSVVEAEAITGKGVEDTFQLVTRLVLREISRKHKLEVQPAEEKEAAKDVERITPDQDPEMETLRLEPKLHIIEPTGYEGTAKDEGMETLSFEPELQIIETDGYAAELAEAVEEQETVEEAIECLGSTYEIAEEMQETVVRQKASPEQPQAKKEALDGKASCGEVFEEIRKISEPSGVLPETIVKIMDDIAGLNTLLLGLKCTTDSIKNDMLEIRESLGEMNRGSALRDENNMRALKKEQKESRSILIDIASVISDIKVKKSWFRF